VLIAEWALTIFWTLDKYPSPIRAEVLFVSPPLYIPEAAWAAVVVYTNILGFRDKKNS